MKNARNALLAMAASASIAFGSEGGAQAGMGPLAILFIAFGALILACQFLPAMALFVSMVAGLFSSAPRHAPNRELEKSA